MVGVIQPVFFLERNVTYLVPFFHECSDLFCRSVICCACSIQFFKLFDDIFFFRQVLYFFGTLGRISFVLLAEEIVTGADETFPDRFGMFLSHRTDRFPFFLQLGKDLCRFFPVCTVFQRFSFLAQGFFLFQILGHVFFDILIESSLLLKEIVACSTETFENLCVHFLRGRADGFPFSLQGKYFLSLVFPVRKCLEGIIFHTFYDLTDNSLLVEVVLFSFFLQFEILLMTAVDDS